jgi:hypothetical protein
MAGKVGPPLVIDLGRIEREDVGQLLSGAGTVLDEVDMAMGLVCQRIDSNGSDRVLLPMVVVYTQKEDARHTPDRLVVKVRARKK